VSFPRTPLPPGDPAPFAPLPPPPSYPAPVRISWRPPEEKAKTPPHSLAPAKTGNIFSCRASPARWSNQTTGGRCLLAQYVRWHMMRALEPLLAEEKKHSFELLMEPPGTCG